MFYSIKLKNLGNFLSMAMSEPKNKKKETNVAPKTLKTRPKCQT